MAVSVEVRLTKPVTAHGEQVSVLTLREPTTKDVIELGLPTLIIPSEDGGTPGVELRQGVLSRYVSRLAQIPRSSVESLTLADFSHCTQVVLGFFGMDDGAATSEPSID